MKKSLFAIFTTLAITITMPGCDLPEDDTDFRGGKKPGCTRTMGWYKNHERWPVSPTYLVCGQTLLDVLETPPEGDHWVVLAHQFITAMLNMMNGAHVDQETSAALLQASPLFWSCTVPAESVELATAASETLDAFNNGLLGAPHCDTLE